MAHPDDLVVQLARAYALSELLDDDDRRFREAVESARRLLEDSDDAELEVAGGEMEAGGEAVGDPHGFVGEMARDLDAAGVRRLVLSQWASLESLISFLRGLRNGAGSGRPSTTGTVLSEPPAGISVEMDEEGEGSDGGEADMASLFERGSPDPEDEPVPEDESLPELVEAYLAAGPGDRPALSERVAAAAASLRQESRLDQVARAVEDLTSAAYEEENASDDGEPLSLARSMVTAGVAARVAVHLADVRDEDARQRMIRVASALGEPMAEAITDALADTSDRAARRAYIETLVAMGDPGIRQAERMIEDGRWFVVRNGVSILGEVGGERGVEHLTSALGHDDSRVRREAVMALARVGGEDAGDLLVGLVDDPDPDVRAAVAMALGVLKVERAVKPLLQRLESESEEDVQVQIIRALGALGDPGAVSAIEKRAVASFFSRPSRPLRIAAYKALSDIGTPHAREVVEAAADDRDPEVRETVQGLLGARDS